MHVQPAMVKRAWGEGGGGDGGGGEDKGETKIKDEVGGAIDRISSAKGPSPSQWNVIGPAMQQLDFPSFGRLLASNLAQGGSSM
jgi:hypothetical protein